MGPPPQQALCLPVRGREGAPHQKRIHRAVPRSFERHHAVPRRRHSQGREGRLRRVRSAHVPRARQEQRGEAGDDARAGRCDEARGVRDVRGPCGCGVPGRGPEEAGRHTLRQHGRLRRGMGHGRREGQVGGRHRSPGEDLRGGRGPAARERHVHSGCEGHRTVREGPRDDSREEAPRWAAPPMP